MILPCTCPVVYRTDSWAIPASEFQHKRYKGKRVHTSLKNNKGFRCTVCGREKRNV
ncbi:hypothetical protein LCGC14_0442760 [marine sediment metagenome]|uniref:Uncharacterized protein n=1 Tax=marine sediment metagenome TaxID=412755 RepID=A0A0F9V709_9ZZZZ